MYNSTVGFINFIKWKNKKNNNNKKNKNKFIYFLTGKNDNIFKPDTYNLKINNQNLIKCYNWNYFKQVIEITMDMAGLSLQK